MSSSPASAARPRIPCAPTTRAKRFSRMLVVYASRAQLDRSQASASVQKGVKEELKEQGGDHAFPITDVRAVVRKAKQFSRERVRAYGRTRACVRACVRAYVRGRRGMHARCPPLHTTRRNPRALRTLPVGADALVRPRIVPQALYTLYTKVLAHSDKAA